LISSARIISLNTGPGVETEGTVPLVEYRHTEDVGRKHVAGELDALEFQPEQVGQGMGQGGLADPGHVLHQQMPAGKHACQGKAHGLFLAKDDPAGGLDEAGGDVDRHGAGFFQNEVKGIMIPQEHPGNGFPTRPHAGMECVSEQAFAGYDNRQISKTNRERQGTVYDEYGIHHAPGLLAAQHG
jgi:hypothetical protein